jgi:hypothetical protein
MHQNNHVFHEYINLLDFINIFFLKIKEHFQYKLNLFLLH